MTSLFGVRDLEHLEDGSGQQDAHRILPGRYLTAGGEQESDGNALHCAPQGWIPTSRAEFEKETGRPKSYKPRKSRTKSTK